MVKTLKYLNLFFFVFMILINILANIIPLGHGNTGAISAKYPNLFTPAPVTFAIWGVIYILVAFFIVYQLDIFNTQMYEQRLIDFIGPWFIISCIMNIGWLFSWHYESLGISMAFMLGLLFSLIMIVTNFSFFIDTIADTSSTSFIERLSYSAFNIYLGWITAATIANASVLLVKIRWDRFGMSETAITNIVLAVGALLGVLFIIFGQRYMASAAIIWAYCGILIKHISQSGYGGEYPSIILVTGICIVSILSAVLISMLISITQ